MQSESIHDPQSIESLIEQMEARDGHLVYELHPSGNPIPGSKEPCAVEPGSEYYPLNEEVSEYQVRCICGETFSSFGTAERHVEKQ